VHDFVIVKCKDTILFNKMMHEKHKKCIFRLISQTNQIFFTCLDFLFFACLDMKSKIGIKTVEQIEKRRFFLLFNGNLLHLPYENAGPVN